VTLQTGARLGPYEILSLLGAGGMGEVYRARDTRLGRDVAIKVLPASFSQDADRLRRFEGEARAASALNHPGILTIHDFGLQDGAPYVVSELLEGETLRERLGPGRLPIRKALDYAAQIARGLAAAHEKGIVHRDLKPENLFVTKDSRVKILDFGLAKLTHPERGVGPLTNVPTQTAGTEPGVVMGTAGYMSPEQVRGLSADARSDIFSFGCVLHEMLTGQRAFRGDTAVETMNAILKEDPPEPSRAAAEVPPALDRIVRHSLEKSPDERFQSARDVAFALESLSDPSDPIRHRKAFLAHRFRTAAFALALLLTAVAAFIAARQTSKPPTLPSYRQLTFQRGRIGSARFAPDGQTIVYGAAWHGDPMRTFTTRGDATESTPLSLPVAGLLSISPSGELAICLGQSLEFGFTNTGTLARVALAGGAPRSVLEEVQDAEWSGDGAELAIVRRLQGRHRLEFPPGKVLYETDGWLDHPRFSPDGSRIAFLDHPNLGDDRGNVSVVARGGGPKTVLTDGWSTLQGLAWSPRGDEVWFSGTNPGTDRAIQAVTLAKKARTVVRTPGSLRLLDIAADGRVLLSRDSLRSEIFGRGSREAAERELSWHDYSIASDISSDGKTLLFVEQGGAGPGYSVYVRETDGSPAVKLGEGVALALSPDKKWALVARLESPVGLALLPTGPGETRTIERGPIESYGYYAGFLPDGKRIVFLASEPGRKPRFYVQSIDGGPPRAISSEGVGFAQGGHIPISPDGRFGIALGTDNRLWLFPTDGGALVPLPGSEGGDTPVGWSVDGRSLFIRNRHSSSPAAVDRLDLATHRRSSWRLIASLDPAGILGVGAVQIARGGDAYVYTTWRVLSDLYLAEGLR
jgi:serine/threonine protein kinase